MQPDSLSFMVRTKEICSTYNLQPQNSSCVVAFFLHVGGWFEKTQILKFKLLWFGKVAIGKYE